MVKGLPTVTPEEMRAIEKRAYADGISEEKLMEAAGNAVFFFASELLEKYSLKKIYLILGKGNNGGDALAAGKLFIKKNIPVTALYIKEKSECSPLYQKKYQEFIEVGGKAFPCDSKDFLFEENALLIDAIFGTGLLKAPKEPYSSIIDKLNKSPCIKLAVDIPSGLCGKTGKVQGSCLRADYTVFLGLPKWGFFLESGPSMTGELFYGDIGLSKHYCEGFDVLYLLKEGVRTFLPPILRTRHKFSRGYAVAVAGSKNTPGAALLSSEACYRAGAGYVRLLYPEGMEGELTSSPYELVKNSYNSERPQDALAYFEKAQSCFIGPGLGRQKETTSFLKELLFQMDIPLVIDADGLYHFSELSLTSSQVVLTPHLGEMYMLLGKKDKPPIDKLFLEEVAEFATKHRVHILLKGVPTFLFSPKDALRIVDFGCPGMATAGSGDVLTGILAALLAQKMSMEGALYLGCYLHGQAGCKAEAAATPYSMMARDIISFLPAVFAELMSARP